MRYDVISGRWSSHFWVKMHVFSTPFNNRSNDAKCLFMCYFTCQAQKLPFFSVLTWFLILGKIKMATIAGDVTGLQQRHHPWNIPHLVEQIKRFKILQHINPSTSAPPLYHGGGMNLHVCPKFKSVENKSAEKGLVFFQKKMMPSFSCTDKVGSHIPSCQHFTVLLSTCLHHCPCFNPIFVPFFDISSVPRSCFKAVLLVRILL